MSQSTGLSLLCEYFARLLVKVVLNVMCRLREILWRLGCWHGLCSGSGVRIRMHPACNSRALHRYDSGR
jgi:hypothetical protein